MAVTLVLAAGANADEPVWLIPLVIGAFAILFPLFWMAVIRLTALLGWGALARLYRFDGTFPEGMQAFKTASLSVGRGAMLANYSGVAILVLRPEALYLRLWWLFGFGHPPLKLPWDAIETIAPRKMLFWTTHLVTLKGTKTTLLLSGNIGETVDTAWQRHRRN